VVSLPLTFDQGEVFVASSFWH